MTSKVILESSIFYDNFIKILIFEKCKFIFYILEQTRLKGRHQNKNTKKNGTQQLRLF